MPDHAPPEPIALQAPLCSSHTNGLPLSGVRILSLALNLPGPAALMRCAAMGAQCSKLEPPSAQPAATDAAGADPMAHYSPQAYADMHQGVAVWQAQLKSDEGQAALHDALDAADILLTFAPPHWPSWGWTGRRCSSAIRSCRWCASSAAREPWPMCRAMT